MSSVLLAYRRAVASLTRPGVLWHLIWPALTAIVLWTLVAVYFWADATAALLGLMARWPWVGDWLAQGETLRIGIAFVVNVLLFMLSVPLVFVTSSILVAVLAIPLILDRVARTDYADLDMRNGGSFFGSVVNALGALILFLVMLIITLPLWLIPGLGLVLSVGLSAWLNQRCYRYDALMMHADRDELKRVPRFNRGGMYVLGIGAGVLAFVPFVNLFVPAFTGLAFVHFLLEALRLQRGARPV